MLSCVASGVHRGHRYSSCALTISLAEEHGLPHIMKSMEVVIKEKALKVGNLEAEIKEKNLR